MKLYTLDEAAHEIGCKSRDWLFALLRKKAVLRNNNEAEPIYCHDGYFVVQDVEIPMGKIKKHYRQTFVTLKGIWFIRGVICGAREKTKTVRPSYPESAGQKAAIENAQPGTGTPQRLG